jgi:hypothetical protein
MPTHLERRNPMAKKTKRRPTKVPQVQAPKQHAAAPRRYWLLYALD